MVEVVQRGWDSAKVAALLQKVPADVLDALDPSSSWGRPVAPDAIEASDLEAHPTTPEDPPQLRWGEGQLLR
eukprot:CAMPEP_0170342064 /NCGR_PEP_ID=MMETSP0116_2-20130129/72174_1 /TAXON_ID=400756 /ORGANISM="Durinskia baltica, Strain CSIRO CS-38" /LENGTH=71 /DNA_ID=CAMNT_0010595651 /DNA_START=182 /DNA_END=393 /DNA_ORIENTATION=+